MSESPGSWYSDRFVEPLERLVGLFAEGIDLRNVVGPILLELGRSM